MIRVGDVVRRTLKIYDDDGNDMRERDVDATVVYIHPSKRFYTLEYRIPGGTFRETEFFEKFKPKGDNT